MGVKYSIKTLVIIVPTIVSLLLMLGIFAANYRFRECIEGFESIPSDLGSRDFIVLYGYERRLWEASGKNRFVCVTDGKSSHNLVGYYAAESWNQFDKLGCPNRVVVFKGMDQKVFVEEYDQRATLRFNVSSTLYEFDTKGKRKGDAADAAH